MTHFMVVTPFVTPVVPDPPRVAVQVANIFEIVPNVLPGDAALGPNDFGCTIKYVNGEQKVMETMDEIVELANGAKVAARAKRAAPKPEPVKPETSAVTSPSLLSSLQTPPPAPVSDTAPHPAA